ncbi:MAG: hypothetical protein AAF651_07200, partial [Cyanobacteria bacterium P01_C01_bin.73]
IPYFSRDPQQSAERLGWVASQAALPSTNLVRLGAASKLANATKAGAMPRLLDLIVLDLSS